MKRTVAIFPLLVVLGSSNSSAQKPLAEVRIETPLNFVVVPVSVKGRPQHYLLDSGFENSVVDEAAAHELGLNASEPTRTSAPGGSVDESHARDVVFSVKGAKHRAERVSVIPLSGTSSLIGRRIDGILGHDFFLRFVVEIDYAAKLLRLYQPATYPRSRVGEIVPLFLRNNEPFIVAALRQKHRPEITALLKLDTGSADFIGFNGSFVAVTSLFAADEPRVALTGVALGGETQNYLARLDTFALGSIRIPRPVVGFSGDLQRVGDAGTIGGLFLSRFRVTFDYRRHELTLVPMASRANAPVDFFDASGMLLAASHDFQGVSVASVMPDSPAAKIGILAGDQILTVDGTPVTKLGLDEVRRRLGTPGRSVSLRIRRGDREIDTVVLTVRLI